MYDSDELTYKTAWTAGQSDAADGDMPSDGSDAGSDQEESGEGKLKRYVVYVVRVRHSKESDGEETTVERRYSDFEQLHGRLSALHPAVVSDLVFPRKLWAGNFSTENIARRCQMFEQYLMHLCDLPVVVCSRPFCEFFFAPELKRQLSCLMVVPVQPPPPPPEDFNGRSGTAVDRAPGSVPATTPSSPTVHGLRSCLLLQLKLCRFVGSEKGVLCAAGLVVAHLDAGNAVAAYAYAMQLITALSLPDRMPSNARRQLFGPLVDLASELSVTLSEEGSSGGGGGEVLRGGGDLTSVSDVTASTNKIGRSSDAAGLAVLHQTFRNALWMASTAAESWAL